MENFSTQSYDKFRSQSWSPLAASWIRGVVVSVVVLTDEVNQRRAQLVPGRVNHRVCNQPARSTRVFHPSGVGKIRISFGWEGKGAVHTDRG